MGTGSFLAWVKRSGRGVHNSLPSGLKVKERVELYLYSNSGPSWPVLSTNVSLTFAYLIVRFEVIGVCILINHNIYFNTLWGGGFRTVFTLHSRPLFLFCLDMKLEISRFMIFRFCVLSLSCIVVARWWPKLRAEFGRPSINTYSLKYAWCGWRFFRFFLFDIPMVIFRIKFVEICFKICVFCKT
jgi:hypothetical protein